MQVKKDKIKYIKNDWIVISKREKEEIEDKTTRHQVTKESEFTCLRKINTAL